MKIPSWFDLPMAVLGALVSGSIVAVINFYYAYLPALTASLKQALYAFVATGPYRPILSLAGATTYPARSGRCFGRGEPLTITMMLLFVVHSMKGTPRPVISTIPGTVLSLIGLLLIAWQTLSTRRQSRTRNRKQ